MNKHRPDCLNGDYKTGCHQLSITYKNLFAAFLNIAKGETVPLVALENKNKNKNNNNNNNNNSPQKSPQKKSINDVLVYKEAPKGSPKKAKKENGAKGGWSYELVKVCNNPSAYGEVSSVDKDIVVMPDKYPKSQHHYLVMPREIIEDFSDLTPDHLPILRALQSKGKEMVKILDPNNQHQFRMGFHAVPSMKQIHMHVISQDFAGPSLKNKKHWNSFTTPYFVDSEEFIQKLATECKSCFLVVGLIYIFFWFSHHPF